MAIYAIWNNKGGAGKSYLTFQIASEYARTHPEQNILVVDLCPQEGCDGQQQLWNQQPNIEKLVKAIE